MFSRKREPDPVGSVVVSSGNPVAGSRRSSEKPSGSEATGPFSVESNVKEKLLPSVIPVRYSLKKDDGESIRVTVPGSVPVTSPVGETAPKVPSVEKPEMVTVLDADPPLIKSKASCAESPEREEVLTFTTYTVSANKLAGVSNKVRHSRTRKTNLSN
jgi:hypothetical protein